LSASEPSTVTMAVALKLPNVLDDLRHGDAAILDTFL
jgi:hypothetical protein